MNLNEALQQVPDYINGHLTADQAQQFEQLLSQNQELAEAVTEAQQWQQQLQQNCAKETEQLPEFANFAPKLRVKNRQWMAWGLTPAAVAALAFLTLGPSQEVNNEFETLTSETQQYQTHAIRIVAHGNVEIEKLMMEYQLDVLKHYPGTSAFDVTTSSDMAQVMAQLQSDQRILMVKQLK